MTPPTGLTVVPGDKQNVLTWAGQSGCKYNLYRGTVSGAETLYKSGLTATTYTDIGLTDGAKYYYKLSAYQESALSAEVSATPAAPAPAYNKPGIYSGTPTSGPVGTVVTLTGYGFTGTTSAAALGPNTSNLPAKFQVISDTQIKVTIPNGAVTGELSVTNPVDSAWWYQTPFTVTGSSAPPVTPPPVTPPPVTPPPVTPPPVTPPPVTPPPVTPPPVTPPPVTPPPTGALTNANDSYAPAAMYGAKGLGISIANGIFVDGSGKPFYPRGANFSGMEFVAPGGWSAADPTGNQGGQFGGPNWAGIKNWKFNIMRLPLNEGSWLNAQDTDSDGTKIDMDPGDNYIAFVDKFIADANANGCIVILDLHWASPGTVAAMLQTQMADQDHSLTFWTQVATRYKNNPAVMFELFNEPFLNFDYQAADANPDAAWLYLMQGKDGVFTGLPETSRTSHWVNATFNWSIASYQDMINAVRATGAKNVVIVGSEMYSSDMSKWLQYHPTDSLNQMACAWHCYPTFQAPYSEVLTDPYCQPNNAPAVWDQISAIIAAGIPVMVTETGSCNTNTVNGKPTGPSGLITNLTKYCDGKPVGSIGALAWTWDIWGDGANVLLKDGYSQTLTADDTAAGFTLSNISLGCPTEGEGKTWFAWTSNHA